MTDERPFPVRAASAEDYAGLAALELAADAVFEQFGIWPLPPRPPHTPDFTDAAAVLVAGRPPVGFARLDLVGAVPHLEQLSVHPAFVRRGVGTALVQACCDWALSNHHSALTLTTFADVPFNAPFYARLGFTVIDPAALPAPLGSP